MNQYATTTTERQGDPGLTLAQAKAQMLETMDLGGAKCLCCAQVVRFYKRPLTAAMATGLILLYGAPAKWKDKNGYIHIENFFKSIPGLPASIRADIPKLRFWHILVTPGGLTQVFGKPDGNPCNGLYKLTEQGRNFVELKITVPSHIKLYNNRFFGHPAGHKMVNIREALKNKFDYDKLMLGEI